MHYFIGKSFNNHAPVSNGKVLGWLQQYQYRQNQLIPVDILNQIFYPNFDLSNNVLDSDGSYILVHDENEKVWYDPYGIVRQQAGQVGEIISIDETIYIDGSGIFKVVSHKGNTVVKTKTWAPWDSNVVIRSIQVKTVKGNPTNVEIFPIVHLQNIVERIENIYISRICSDRWLAVTVIPSLESNTGDVGTIVTGGRITIFEHSSLPMPVIFKSKQGVPVSKYSQPIYLIFSLGQSKEEVIEQLNRTSKNVDTMYENSLLEWKQWSERGLAIPDLNPQLQYYWSLSNSLLRMSLQENGAPIIIGFRPYQGNVWVRDGIWMITTLAYSGHFEEALKGLYSLIGYLKIRPDGNYYAAYNVTTGTPNEHAFENDSTGLILYGIWCVYSITLESKILKDFWSVIRYSANWIINNRDNTGLIKPDAGIWETFGPHLGEKFEHMTWTSAISSFGLYKASVMAQALEYTQESNLYSRTANELLYSISKNNVENNIVYRSMEKKLMDASVLLFFSEFDIFPKEWLNPTINSVIKYLEDPFLGGIWRHESLTTEEGDMRPWTGPTFWLGEALIAAKNSALAWHYYNHNYENSAFCGLLPELMYNKDTPRGIAMPSYSQSGVIRSILYERYNNLFTKR